MEDRRDPRLRSPAVASLAALALNLVLFSGQAQADGCPDTFAKWNLWRSEVVSRAARPEDFAVSAKLIEDCQQSSAAQGLLQNPRLQACLAPLKRVQKFMELYAQSEKAGDFELMAPLFPPAAPLGPQDPADLEALDPAYAPDKIAGILSVADPKSPAVEAWSRDFLRRLPKDSKAIVFESNTTGASMIFITPGDAEDRFVHLATHGGEKFILAINIQKKDAKGNPLAHPNPHFNIWNLGEANGQYTLTRRPGFLTANCLMCHRAGLMPIALNEGGYQKMFGGGTPAEQADPTTWFNYVFAPTLAGARFQGFDTHMMGPPIGEVAAPTRSDAFMEGCSKRVGVTLTKERRDKVRDSMNCAACHGGGSIGIVSYPFKAIGPFPSLLDSVVTAGAMPPYSCDATHPDAYLTIPERMALLACLKAEYFGGFTDPSLEGGQAMGTYLRDLLAVPCPDDAGKVESESDSAAAKHVSAQPISLGSSSSQPRGAK